jgi:hypothetical protein
VSDNRPADSIPIPTRVRLKNEKETYLSTLYGKALALFNRITGQFPSGQIIFDAYSRLTVWVLNLAVKLTSLRSKPTAAGSSVFLPWGIDDPHELEREVSRLRLVTATPFLTLPELVERLSKSKFQTKVANMMGSMGWYRRSMQHYRFEF